MSQRSELREKMVSFGLGLIILFMRLAAALVLVVKWLTSTLLGLFSVAVVLYLTVLNSGSTEPYTAGELLAWFADLSANTKTTISTSLLTIIGFLIAFQTATKNWKDQLRSQYELAASHKITAFFDDVSGNIVQAEVFAKGLLEAVEFVASETEEEKINKIIKQQAKRSDDFVKVRSKLIGRPLESTRLRNQYSIVLGSHLLALKEFDTAVEAMEDIIAHVGIPRIVDASTLGDPKEFFLYNVNVDICRKLISACDEHLSEMNGSAGTVVGILESPVMGNNLAMFMHALRFSRSDIDDLRQSFKRVMNKLK